MAREEQECARFWVGDLHLQHSCSKFTLKTFDANVKDQVVTQDTSRRTRPLYQP
jgi:hypothetical protein